MTYDNPTQTGSGFALGLLCGVAVGAALGMLFAPYDGRELRNKIGEQARRAGTQGREAYDSARRAVNDAVSAGRDAFNKTRTDTTTPAGADI
jgi:gas vesicle protein